MYVPVVKLDMVLLVPVPDIAPGLIIQLPDGKPFNITLPVASAQVGWVIVPIAGAEGVTGCALMTTLADAGDVHPAAFVTV